MGHREVKGQGNNSEQRPEVQAIVWDYDGTLLDTRRKNLAVTRALIPAVSGRPLGSFAALASSEAYAAANERSANWRELFGREFGLSDALVDEAGRSWTHYQMADTTPAPFFEGVGETLERLKGLRQAIFSQNSRDAILLALEAAGLAKYFTLVIGYEEVAFGKQKPAPDGLLLCLEQLEVETGTTFFVGDHDTDMACAERANVALQRRGVDLTVVSVGTEFGGQRSHAWSTKPDRVARRPVEVADGVNGTW